MEKHHYSDCNCPKQGHHCDNDLDYKNYSCTPCYPHKCCSQKCSPHQNCHDRCYRSCHRCRKDLCDTDFSIRLGGLQDGLNFRLRQLLWCEVEFELDDGNTVKGTIVFVGSNFVEVLVKETLQLEKELDKDYEERKHKKGKSWIFSIAKITNIKVNSSCYCSCQCTCY